MKYIFYFITSKREIRKKKKKEWVASETSTRKEKDYIIENSIHQNILKVYYE